MSEGGDEDDVTGIVSLLDDEYARAILAQTSTEPMSATELVEQCNASSPTIYRRINRLQEYDLLAEEQQIDPDGHHYKRYVARLDQVTINLGEGEFSVGVSRTDEGSIDRFTRLYEGLR